MLSCLLMFLGSLSSLIWVHSVCFHDQKESEGHLNICSRCKKQMTFSGQNKYFWDKGFIFGAEPSSTSLYCLCQQLRLRQDCPDAHAHFFLLLSTRGDPEISGKVPLFPQF